MRFKLILMIVFISIISNVSANECMREVHCKHFFYGCPIGWPATNDLIIRDIYVLCNNDDTKFADWLAYRLDKSNIVSHETKRVWKPDPWLEENETLEPDDYKGAYNTLHTDRGHQAPLASFQGTGMWEETNYLSNITPQKSKLNRGPWKTLEEQVRDLLTDFDVVYVMTGTLYEKSMPALPGADEPHRIPSGYWKIVCVPLSKNKFETAAFIFDQDDSGGSPVDYLTSIDEIEKRSGLDVLWELPDAEEAVIEASLDKNWADKYFK